MSTPRRSRLSSLCFSLFETDRGALALLAVLFFGVNWRLLAGQVSERWDGEDFFAPFYNYVASLAREGRLLHWNPFFNAGSPDFAEPQVGAFSPLTLLCGLIAGPGPAGFHFYWLCTWLFGGVGMYVFARALSAPPWGALVVSLGFVFSGYYIGHAEHVSVVYTYSFVPWTLWRVRAALTTGRRWPACEAGALWGLSALAGNPAVHIPAAMFAGLVAPAWLPPAAPGVSRWTRWRVYVVTMGLMAVVGTLVLAPAYGSFRYEAAGYSHRAQALPRAMVLDKGYGFGWLTALATPSAVAVWNTIPAWGEFDISMRLIYFGSVVPVLAVLAVWRRRGDWRTWLVLGAGLLYLGFAMGSGLPLRAWLYDLVPPTRFFRNAPMFRGFFVLAMAMLAAPGSAFIESCRREGKEAAGRRLRPLAVAAGAGAAVAVAAYAWLDLTLPDEVSAQLSLITPLHLAFAWVGLAALGAVVARRAGSVRFLPGALVILTAADLTTACFLTIHVAYQRKPSTVAAGPVGELTDLGAAGFARTLASPHNANLYSRQTVAISYAAMENPDHTQWTQDGQMRAWILGPQRLWFAAAVPTVPATSEAFAAFRERADALGTLPLVRQERASLLQPGEGLSAADRAAIAAAPAAQPLDCQVLAYHADDLALRVVCPADGFLLVTDRWSRSWTATVNGTPVPIDGGDFLFRLVPVRAGENLVAMQFRVPWLYPLLVLSWGTLAIVGAVSLWSLRRPGKMASGPPVGIRPASVKSSAPVAV